MISDELNHQKSNNPSYLADIHALAIRKHRLKAHLLAEAERIEPDLDLPELAHYLSDGIDDAFGLIARKAAETADLAARTSHLWQQRETALWRQSQL